MMKIAYQQRSFYRKTKVMIDRANEIIDEYQAQGFDLTIRQLHYQFVSRDLGPNTQQHYNQLGKAVSNARRAGLIDWLAIVDRTRYMRKLNHWESEADILAAVAQHFRVDKWKRQPYKPRVWIEKDALIGVISGTCDTLDVPFFSCRGFSSDSALWRSAQEFQRETTNGYTPVVIHLSDHDPSGLDMTRDIKETLNLFQAHGAIVKRIALTMDQVNEYNPPPNFAKEKDPRFPKYRERYGELSWELDALDPAFLAELIRETILSYRDNNLWNEDVERENDARSILEDLSDNIEDVREFLTEANQ